MAHASLRKVAAACSVALVAAIGLVAVGANPSTMSAQEEQPVLLVEQGDSLLKGHNWIRFLTHEDIRAVFYETDGTRHVTEFAALGAPAVMFCSPDGVALETLERVELYRAADAPWAQPN